MILLRYLLKVSRPRFWLYLAGPFLIGLGNHIDTFSLYAFLYFLIPANFFLYGVNDLWDKDTDALNVKKSSREVRIINNQQEQTLKKYVTVSLLLSLPLFIFADTTVRLLFGVFFLLAYFYSAFPIRLKGRYFFDSMSNVLYIIPGIISYVYVTGEMPPLAFCIAGALWASSMHLFSAIPDIIPDTKSGVRTTAVLLGTRKSLLLCSIYWGLAGYAVQSYRALFLIGLLYSLIPLVLYLRHANPDNILKVYWYFPMLNGVIGFTLYLYRILGL